MGRYNVGSFSRVGNLPLSLSALFACAFLVLTLAACASVQRVRTFPEAIECPTGYRFLYRELRAVGELWVPAVVCERMGLAR